MERSTERPFSAISVHSSIKGSPHDIGKWLMSSQADFPASPSALKGCNLVPTTRATCGPIQPLPLASYDRASRSWRTCQGSLDLSTSERSSPTWNTWGILHGGVVFQLANLAPHTHDSDCSFWPTPLAAGWDAHRTRRNGGARFNRIATENALRAGRKVSALLLERLMGWPDGWSAVRPLEMGKFRQWLGSHGVHLPED